MHPEVKVGHTPDGRFAVHILGGQSRRQSGLLFTDMSAVEHLARELMDVCMSHRRGIMDAMTDDCTVQHTVGEPSLKADGEEWCLDLLTVLDSEGVIQDEVWVEASESSDSYLAALAPPAKPTLGYLGPKGALRARGSGGDTKCNGLVTYTCAPRPQCVIIYAYTPSLPEGKELQTSCTRARRSPRTPGPSR